MCAEQHRTRVGLAPKGADANVGALRVQKPVHEGLAVAGRAGLSRSFHVVVCVDSDTYSTDPILLLNLERGRGRARSAVPLPVRCRRVRVKESEGNKPPAAESRDSDPGLGHATRKATRTADSNHLRLRLVTQISEVTRIQV